MGARSLCRATICSATPSPGLDLAGVNRRLIASELAFLCWCRRAHWSRHLRSVASHLDAVGSGWPVGAPATTGGRVRQAVNSPNARLDATIVVLALFGVAQLFLGFFGVAILCFATSAAFLIYRLILLKRSRNGEGR